MDMDSTLDRGYAAEKLACCLLTKHGLKIVATNWRAGKLGELDIVCRIPWPEQYVVVEVRSRQAGFYDFSPVSYHKLARLKKLARKWAHSVGKYKFPLRLDLLLVTPVRVLWMQGVDSPACREVVLAETTLSAGRSPVGSAT